MWYLQVPKWEFFINHGFEKLTRSGLFPGTWEITGKKKPHYDLLCCTRLERDVFDFWNSNRQKGLLFHFTGFPKSYFGRQSPENSSMSSNLTHHVLAIAIPSGCD